MRLQDDKNFQRLVLLRDHYKADPRARRLLCFAEADFYSVDKEWNVFKDYEDFCAECTPKALKIAATELIAAGRAGTAVFAAIFEALDSIDYCLSRSADVWATFKALSPNAELSTERRQFENAIAAFLIRSVEVAVHLLVIHTLPSLGGIVWTKAAYHCAKLKVPTSADNADLSEVRAVLLLMKAAWPEDDAYGTAFAKAPAALVGNPRGRGRPKREAKKTPVEFTVLWPDPKRKTYGYDVVKRRMMEHLKLDCLPISESRVKTILTDDANLDGELVHKGRFKDALNLLGWLK